MTSCLVTCSNPRFCGTNSTNMACLTAAVALLIEDFEVWNIVDRIWFDDRVLNFQRNTATDCCRLLFGVSLTCSFTESQTTWTLSLLSKRFIICIYLFIYNLIIQIYICKGMEVIEVQMIFFIPAAHFCNKPTMLSSMCSVVGYWHMASLLKRPSFIWAGQHLFLDGIRTLCSTNTAVRHSGDTTTNFGPGFLLTTQYAWVFTVDVRVKGTEGGLAKRFLFLLLAGDFGRSLRGVERNFPLDSLY